MAEVYERGTLRAPSACLSFLTFFATVNCIMYASHSSLSFRAPTENGLLFVNFRSCYVTSYGRDARMGRYVV